MSDFVKAVCLNELGQKRIQEIINVTRSSIAKWFKDELVVEVVHRGVAESKCLLNATEERILGMSAPSDWLTMSLGTDASALNLSPTLQNKAVAVFLKELLSGFAKPDALINTLQLKDVSSPVAEKFQLRLSVKANGYRFLINFYPAFFLLSQPTRPEHALVGSWADVFADNVVSLDVIAGKVRLTLNELKGIAEGDVLQLQPGQSVKNEFEVYMKNSLITTARLAKQSGQRIAVIQTDGE